MEEFSVEEYQESQKSLKVCSVSKCKLKWKINRQEDNFYSYYKKSPEFSIEPQSTWYSEFKIENGSLFKLNIIRKCDNSHCFVRFDLNITNLSRTSLHKYSGSVFCRTEIKIFDVIDPNICLNMLDDTVDQLLFIVSLEVWNPENSKLQLLQIPSDILQSLPPDIKDIIDDSAGTTTNHEANFIAALCPKSFTVGRLLQKITVDKMDDSHKASLKKMESFIFSKLVKSSGFFRAINLYRIACFFSIPELIETFQKLIFKRYTFQILK